MRKKKENKPFYKSALCGLGNAVTTANTLHEEGYHIMWCFAVVADNEEGKPTQAIYMLAQNPNND